MALLLLIPSTLLAWVVFLGTYMANAPLVERISTAVGIGIGSFGWFAFVAYVSHRGKQFLQKYSTVINHLVGYFLMGFGVYSIAKALNTWFPLY